MSLLRLLVAVALLALGGCASLIPPAPSPNQATLTMVYREDPDAVLAAYAETARSLPQLAEVSASLDGLIAVERPGGNEGLLTVVVARSEDLTTVQMVYDYLPNVAEAWSHLPIALARAVGEGGLHGAAVAQIRAPAPADDCPSPADWMQSAPPLAADSTAPGPLAVQPVLIGGLEGLQRRVEYPSLARRAGIAGQVFARFITGRDGGVRCAEIVSGLPGGLSEEVLRVTAESRFEPGTLDGEPVEVMFMLPVSFWLR